MDQKIKSDEGICIGRNISRIRQEKGWTQEEMTARLQLAGVSISRATYAKMELGTHSIGAATLKAIRDLLETTYEELMSK